MDEQTEIADLRQRLAAAEAALSASDARLAAMFDSVPVGVAMLDMDGRIVASNAEYHRFCPTGVMPSRDAKRTWRWRGWDRDQRPLDPSEFPGARAQRGESVVPGQEMLFTDDSGAEIWVRVATTPIRDAEGRVAGQASVISDIDMLKRSAETLHESQQRQAFLLRLSDAITALDDPVAIQQRAVDLVAEALGVDRCAYGEIVVTAGVEQIVVDADHRPVEATGLSGVHPVERIGADLAQLRAGRIVAADDARELSAGSRLVVPVMKRGRLTAALAVWDAGSREWTPGDIALLRESAERLRAAVDHARTEAHLRRSDVRFREAQARAQLLVEGIAVATWETPPDGSVASDSPSWRAYTGQTYEEWLGFGWTDAIHPDDRAASLAKWQTARDRGDAVDIEYRLRAKNGDYRWMNARAIALLDDAGEIQKWLGMNIDIDMRKRLEQRVLDDERRMRALVEGVPQLLWRAILPGEWSWASPQWTAFTGQAERDSHGGGWIACLHPDDREAVRRAWALAPASGGIAVDHRLRRADGAYRWFGTRAVPVRDDQGRIVEWLGTSNDIDALRQAQNRQDVLVSELQHRTRNLIAVVRSLCDKTLDGSTSLATFERRFNDRLSALARVQGLLSHASAGQRVTFAELLRSELLAVGAIDRDEAATKLTFDGPADVPLRSGSIQILALALHELATNAVKYGALKSDTGRLAVSWRMVSDDDNLRWLDVDWRESGVDLSDAGPHASGYGRQLIERALPYQLGARTRYAFAADGVHCTIAVPVVSDHSGKENI
ncbi:PAS domain-containing protein [Sphingomonas sp. RP10(2022)]|uniref:histidine kinase n=1 Tax=Sphingomonas liriopis TaxID=2949094 RepID=A0A9X2KPI2_9SPHN|nr:PAS domain-containing protein [Sphingomonas liriopis]MCP3733556.1 PAS domain-containing protein [Sphingomonas liriopis]